MDDATLQFLEFLIASELGGTASLLLPIRVAAPRATPPEDKHLPDVYLRLALAVVLGATLLRSLAAHVSRRESERSSRDDWLVRLVPTAAPGVVIAATRGEDP